MQPMSERFCKIYVTTSDYYVCVLVCLCKSKIVKSVCNTLPVALYCFYTVQKIMEIITPYSTYCSYTLARFQLRRPSCVQLNSNLLAFQNFQYYYYYTFTLHLEGWWRGRSYMYDCMHGVPRCRFLISIACMLNMLYGDLYCMWWVCGGFRNGAAAVFSIYMILMQFQVRLFSVCVLEFHASRLPGSNCLVSMLTQLSFNFFLLDAIDMDHQGRRNIGSPHKTPQLGRVQSISDSPLR